MTTKRRFFTDKFKREAVALLESSGRPLEQVAKEGSVRTETCGRAGRFSDPETKLFIAL
ncbi:transposase [Azospirillum doebereinerae]|uniref:Transposase n=1 Tax=Azospirillum doebereinerae TaxID=92933 RepID=A0A433J063_9PROT|nr:transposase [Azospirillum doebereinerae]RUQ62051.1 transposase [Azospirillum doebereinerae]